VLNVFNLLQWCFDHLSPVQAPHSGVNVSPRMAVPDQGFEPIQIWLCSGVFAQSGIRIRHKAYIQRHTKHGLHFKYMKVRRTSR
jgi:hypothetical protein